MPYFISVCGECVLLCVFVYACMCVFRILCLLWRSGWGLWFRLSYLYWWMFSIVQNCCSQSTLKPTASVRVEASFASMISSCCNIFNVILYIIKYHIIFYRLSCWLIVKYITILLYFHHCLYVLITLAHFYLLFVQIDKTYQATSRGKWGEALYQSLADTQRDDDQRQRIWREGI